MTSTGTRRDLRDLADEARQAIAPASPEDVTLWVIDLRAFSEAYVADRDHLTADELDSAGRRPPTVSDRFIRRRLVRRALLAAHTGLDIDEVQVSSVCRHCGDRAHGKPELLVGGSGSGGDAGEADRSAREPRVEFNTASCDDIFVMAVSRYPVGVDVEHSGRLDVPTGLRLSRFTGRRWPALGPALPPGTTPVRSWAAGEALSKGLGLGLEASAADMAAAVGSWTLRWLQPEPGPQPDLEVCVAVQVPAASHAGPTITVHTLAGAWADAATSPARRRTEVS